MIINNCLFEKRDYLTNIELNKLFQILASNMQAIGFSVKDGDKDAWQEGLKQSLMDENEYCFVIYKNGNLCGYIEVNIINNQLHICEVELSNKCKQTRLIYEIIKFLFNYDDFKKYEDCYYSVNKQNPISFKTFEHIGGVKIRESETKMFYKLSRKDIDNYLKNLNKVST